jgi:uncharacterized integral membrane protein
VGEDHDGTDAGGTPSREPSPPSGPSTVERFRTGAARGLGIAAVALFTAFALANRQRVDFSWLFGDTQVQEVGGDPVGGGVPLIVLLLVAFVLGGVVGAVLVSLRGRARRRSAAP